MRAAVPWHMRVCKRVMQWHDQPQHAQSLVPMSCAHSCAGRFFC
jgi:hypothetical protein